MPLVTDARQILDDPEVDIVIEVIGGEEPRAPSSCRRSSAASTWSLPTKKSWPSTGRRSWRPPPTRGVTVAYEASVGGGIPLIGPFQLDLAANDISSVVGIVNGTTNYILTRMTESGASFADALREAQDLGYAEPDPTNDVEAWDAAYKLAILASLAFGAPVMPEQILREGITHVSQRDILYAGEMGYRVKLLAIARLVEGQVEARVHPSLVHQGSMLASVNGSFNAVQVEGDLIGTALFYGRGAGSEPTASAIIADLIAHARGGGGRHVPAVCDLGVRHDAARPALLPVGAWRHRPPGRSADGAQWLRGDAADAGCGPFDRSVRPAPGFRSPVCRWSRSG